MEAGNGKEVLELLKQNDFDVILMDVQMPLVDGYEATRNIRQKFYFPKNATPIIALTASVIRSDLDKCRQAGMNDYVPKPFKTSQLISAIASAAGRKIEAKHKNKAGNKESSISNSQSSIINLSYLEKFCEGDKIRMKKYIGMFLDAAPGLIEKINAALSKNDFEEIASQVHAYKTKWIMMGMKEAKDLALKIEKLCRETPVNGFVKQNVSVLTGQIKEAVNELKKYA